MEQIRQAQVGMAQNTSAVRKTTESAGSQVTQRWPQSTEPRQKLSMPRGVTEKAWRVTRICRSDPRRRSMIYRTMYGTPQQFMDAFHVTRQAVITNDIDACYFGTAPTLRCVAEAYGPSIVSEWLIYQLADLSEFAGCKDKVQQYQLRQLAEIIAADYAYLKITELMLFFRKFKSGAFGVFYGQFDPITVTTALRQFLKYDRAVAQDRHEQQLRKDWSNDPFCIGHQQITPYDLDDLRHWQRVLDIIARKKRTAIEHDGAPAAIAQK